MPKTPEKAAYRAATHYQLPRVLEDNYGLFIEENQKQPEAPKLVMVGGRPRFDVKGRVEFLNQIFTEGNAFSDAVGKKTIFTDEDWHCQSVLTDAASTHTTHKIEVNGHTMNAHCIIWLFDMFNDDPVRWGEMLERLSPQAVAKVLAQGVETAVQILAEGKNLTVASLLMERLRIYYLSGYTALIKRFQRGNGRGTQSAADLHVNVAYFDYDEITEQKNNVEVSGYDLVKQLSPLNTLLMERCGPAIRSLIHSSLSKIGYKNVRIKQTRTHEASRESKNLSTTEEIIIEFPESISIEKAFQLLIPLYEDLQAATEEISAAYMTDLSNAGNLHVQEFMHNETVKRFQARFNLSHKHTKSLLKFSSELQPTYLALQEAYAVAESPASREEIAKLLKQMEYIQERFIPIVEGKSPKQLELEMQEKFEEFVNFLKRITEIPEPLVPAYATFLIDRIKPKELIHTVKSVIGMYFSSFMHFGGLTQGEDGHIYVKELRLSPVIASELGGAEREIEAVFARGEGK